jgi:FtsP/CotA-like multicopper oxidase with cupredoxin domain
VFNLTLTVEAFRYRGAIDFTTRAYCFEGQCGIPGPTIVMRPDQRVVVTLVNNLGPDQADYDSYDHNTLHSPNTTNLHTHGMHIDPEEDSILVRASPGTSITFDYSMPHHHAPGMHWYHSHIHGASTFQVMGGLVGAILVPPNQDIYFIDPDFEAMDQKVVVFTYHKFGAEFGDACTKDIWIEDGGVYNQFKVYSLDEMVDLHGSHMKTDYESKLPHRIPYLDYIQQYGWNVTDHEVRVCVRVCVCVPQASPSFKGGGGNDPACDPFLHRASKICAI